jgi:HlyD family secretion protein
MVSADGTSVAQDPASEPETSEEAAEAAENNPSTTTAEVEKPLSAREIRHEKKRLMREEKQRRRIAKQVMPFQSDAVELEHRKVAGGARWTLYISILLICSTIGWATWAKIDKIVISNGELVPVDTPIVVQPVLSAPIKSINVRVFDRVKAGQLLAVLDPTFTDSDIAQLKSDISKAEAAIARLKVELSGFDRVFEIGENPDPDLLLEFHNYQVRKLAREAKLAEFEATLAKLDVKQVSNRQMEKEYADMEKNYLDREKRMTKLVNEGSANQLALQDIQLQLKRYHAEVTRIRGDQAQTTAELVSTGAMTKSFLAEWKKTAMSEQLQAQKELDKALEALKKAAYNKERAEIFVPVDTPHEEFYVIQIAERTTGSMVQAGEPLMRLIPIKAELEAEVEILGKDIGQLSVDMDLPVRVKMTSFEYQKFGTLDGKIRTISEGTVQKQAGEGKPALSVYKARITIDFDHSEKFTKPGHFKPLPGMSVITDIKVGERRVIEYFLYPFLKHLDVAAREP